MPKASTNRAFMPLLAATLAGPEAKMAVSIERVRIDSVDQLNFPTREIGRERSRQFQSGIICLSPCQYRIARRVLESLLD